MVDGVVSIGADTQNNRSKLCLLADIVKSRANVRFVQPHFPWADNIISHRISKESFSKLQEIYEPAETHVVTRYYETDRVLTHRYNSAVNSNEVSCTVQYHQGVIEHSPLEAIQLAEFPISVSCFPGLIQYHSERQSVEYIKRRASYTFCLEMLLEGIRNPMVVLSESSSNAIENERVISYSYRFYLHDITKAALMDHLVTLEKHTYPEPPHVRVWPRTMVLAADAVDIADTDDANGADDANSADMVD